jgi:hypothetical protein
MKDDAALGLTLALVSTVALNWGFFAQHGAAVALPPLRLRRPVWSLRVLVASRRWLTGFAVGLAGWGLYVIALDFAPLSLVQAVSAGGLGILALLVRLSPGDYRPSRREWAAVAVSVAGLGLLAVSLVGGAARGATPSPAAVAVWLLALSSAGLLVAASTLLGLPAAAALGAASGIFYATGDVATKAAVANVAILFVPVVLAAHGVAFAVLQLAFQRGGALVTVGLSTLLTNAVPIAAGTALFAEHVPSGALGGVRVVAFLLVIAGAALLARPGPSL